MIDPILAKAAKGFRYVLVSQVVVLILGLLKAFLIPALLSIPNYGYWQIYVFYTTYVGIFGLGFNDGLYLRYGNHEINELPLATIRASVRLYTMSLIFSAIVFSWIYSYDADVNSRSVMYLVAANIPVMGLLAIFSQILQATNQIKRYSFLNSADKLIFLASLFPLVAFSFDSYLLLAIAELGSKIFVLACICYLHKDLLLGPSVKFVQSLQESFENIKSGSQLMLANFTGMLVLGIGRIIIEYFDTLDSYAYYAFGVSMSNLALVAITALSVVAYPTLKRLPESSYLQFYNTTNRRLIAFSCLMLFSYFPAVLIIEWKLQKYSPVIPYLNVLIAITALQAKMQLLNNTYYKAMRLESAMLIANLSSLVIVATLSSIGYALTHRIESIAYAALFTMLYRVYASERYLRRQMGSSSNGTCWVECFTLATFLVVTTVMPFDIAMLVSFVLVCICQYVMRKELKSLINLILGKAL